MAADLEQDFYNLKNVFCTLKTGQAGLIDISIKRNPVYAKKWPGRAPVPDQVYTGEDMPDLNATIYNDKNFAFKDAIPNTSIDTLELTSLSDGPTVTFFQSDFFTKFPASSMTFGGADTTLNGTDVSSFKVPIMCRVLNPGADGGFPTLTP